MFFYKKVVFRVFYKLLRLKGDEEDGIFLKSIIIDLIQMKDYLGTYYHKCFLMLVCCL